MGLRLQTRSESLTRSERLRPLANTSEVGSPSRLAGSSPEPGWGSRPRALRARGSLVSQATP